MSRIAIGIVGFLLGMVVMSYISATFLLSDLDLAVKCVNIWLQPISILLTMIIVLLAYAAISTQMRLHRELNRPIIIVDFVKQDVTIHFRIKNFGSCLGRDITVSLEVQKCNSNSVGNEQEDSVIEKLMRLYPVQNGIAALSPNAEMFYFLYGPDILCNFHVQININYADSCNRRFEESFEYKMSDFTDATIPPKR